MTIRTFLALWVLLPVAARADIFQWQDGGGVQHFTNMRDEVPAQYRDDAQVVVNEVARRAAADASTPPSARDESPAEASAAPIGQRQAQVVYDRSQLTDAYLDGLQRGLEAAAAPRAETGAVQITGPLAIANAMNTMPPSYGAKVPWGYPYYPFVTTSFDRGRSRHLTLRMLLQDQFALDRDGPFGFEERFMPPFGRLPLSVELNPFLARGLPYGAPRQTRVIAR